MVDQRVVAGRGQAPHLGDGRRRARAAAVDGPLGGEEHEHHVDHRLAGGVGHRQGVRRPLHAVAGDQRVEVGVEAGGPVL